MICFTGYEEAVCKISNSEIQKYYNLQKKAFLIFPPPPPPPPPPHPPQQQQQPHSHPHPQGLIRIGGRLQKSDLQADAKHPLLLSRDSS